MHFSGSLKTASKLVKSFCFAIGGPSLSWETLNPSGCGATKVDEGNCSGVGMTRPSRGLVELYMLVVLPHLKVRNEATQGVDVCDGWSKAVVTQLWKI